MKTLYLDIFSGISGDMFIGALIDLGVEIHALEKELDKLNVEGFRLHISRQERGRIAGVKFDVHVESDASTPSSNKGVHSGSPAQTHSHSHSHSHSHPHSHDHDHGHDAGEPHSPQHHDHQHGHAHEQGHDHGHEHHHGRTHAEIRHLISQSALSPWVKERAQSVFHRIAAAEGKIHGESPESVHFHEVGAVDSIVDIVGACVALEQLGRPRVLAGAVVEGVGFVNCAHGRFPLPAPATLEILGARGVELQQTDEPGELITPTGAALLAEFAETFGPIEGLKVERIGYGLGGRENRTRPNVLRAILGHATEQAVHDWERDDILLLETNLDDVSGEVLGAVLERAMALGALDVFHTPIQMKKNRPGVLLSILCSAADADRFTEMLLRETTSFGVRRSSRERRKLRRELRRVKTSVGEIEVKLGWLDGKQVQVAPEYESCKLAAERHGRSLREVYEIVRQACGTSGSSAVFSPPGA